MTPTPGAITATTPTATKPSDWLAGLFGFALMIAYWPGIAGVASTARWDVAAALAVALFFAPRVRMTGSHWLGLGLVGWMFLTLIWNGGGTDGRLDGVEAGFEIVIAAIAFAVGSTMLELRSLLIGVAIGVGINSAFAVAQWYGFDGWGDLIQNRDSAPAGLFYEKNRLAAAAAMVAVGLAATPRLWMLLPLVAPSLILPQSRAAWLATLVGIVATTRHARLLLPGIGLMVAAWVVLVAFHVDLGPSDTERMEMWRDTVANLNFFGHGLGSFREVFLQVEHYYSMIEWHSRAEHPHNELLWLMFEGGVPAFILAILVSATLFAAARGVRERGILACLCVLCGFAMPLHDPATLVLGAIVAGHLAGRHALARCVTFDCRGEICPWVAAVECGNWA